MVPHEAAISRRSREEIEPRYVLRSMRSLIPHEVIGAQAMLPTRTFRDAPHPRHHLLVHDIYSIRRTNLAWVCELRAGKNQSQLARDLDISPGLANRYLKNKPIGDMLARRVEQRYGLGFGWMDNAHPTELDLVVLRAYQSSDEKVKRAIEGALGIGPFVIPERQRARQL